MPLNLLFASKEWQGFWKLSSQILNQSASTSTISLSLSFFFGVLEVSSSSLSSSDESYSKGSSFPLISLHSYLSPMVTFEISPDISLPIPTPEHVGVIPESLFIMIFELRRVVAMLYWSHWFMPNWCLNWFMSSWCSLFEGVINKIYNLLHHILG